VFINSKSDSNGLTSIWSRLKSVINEEIHYNGVFISQNLSKRNARIIRDASKNNVTFNELYFKFHSNYHLRSEDASTITESFPLYDRINIKTSGNLEGPLIDLLSK